MGREVFPIKLKVIHQKSKRNCVGQVYTSNPPNGVSKVVLKIQKKPGEYRHVLVKFYTMKFTKDGDEDVLRIGARFAELLGLENNIKIHCSVIQCLDVPDCVRAKAELPHADWELIGKNKALVENHLRQQIQVIHKGLTFPLWVRKNRVDLRIVDVSTGRPDYDRDGNIAYLNQFTDLIIDICPSSAEVGELQGNPFCTPFMKRPSNFSTPKRLDSLHDDLRRQNRSFLDWGRGLLQSMAGNLLRGVSDAGEEGNTETPVDGIVYKTPSKRLLANEAAATARRAEWQSKMSPGEPEKRPSPVKKSGRLFRLQKKPTNFFQTLLEIHDHPDDTCLIRQPTTLFVSDWSFPDLADNQRVGEVLVSVQVAEEVYCNEMSDINDEVVAKFNGSDSSSAKDSGNGDSGGSGGRLGLKGVPARKLSSSLLKRNGCCSFVGRLFICKNDTLEESKHVQSGHVVLHDTMRRFLRAGACSTLLIKPLEGLNSKVQGITLQSVLNKVGGVYEKDRRDSFWAYLSEVSNDSSYPLPVVDGQLASIGIKFQPMVGKIDFLMNITEGHGLAKSPVETKPKYFLLRPNMAEHVHVTAHVEPLSPTDPDAETRKQLPPASVHLLDPKLPSVQLSDLGGVENLAKEGFRHLCSCLANQVVRALGEGCLGLSGGGLLISGTSRDGGGSLGIGKTSLANALCRAMTEPPVLAYVVTLECALLRGKAVSNVQKQLKAIFDEAACHQPSIILLDNLDHLISAPTSGMAETGGDALYGTKLAETLCDLIIGELHRGTVIALIATSRSRDSLHPSLLPRRGQHVFQKVLELKAPDKAQRKRILEAIVRRKKCDVQNESHTLELVAQRTYGYGAQDLLKLVDRTAHRSLVNELDRRSITMMPASGLAEPVGVGLDGRHVNARLFGNRKPLTYREFGEEIDSCQPSSLRSVPLHTPGDLGWSDVGGLDEVKSILVETLEWPSKYPELFAKCPLRLRSGLLLYGAPGTGKTLLAGVVAKECGLNFISIKGPELLNKYIGASEQAVRSMFERAQSAQPCILFFDEFDSIAPKRGHDNTGVTDRVVNQFLTQLDGVEGLQGVYVLAATSRPDMIDPALLRPGRLDKCLFLPMPDDAGRQAILKALSRDVHLDKKVDLGAVASDTKDFSGADLKALLYNAQLESIRQSKEYTPSVERAPTTPHYQKGVTLGLQEKGASLKTASYLGNLEEIVEDECDGVDEVDGSPGSDPRSIFTSSLDVKQIKQQNFREPSSRPLSDLRPKHLSLGSRTNSDGSIDIVPVCGYFMPSIAEGVKEMTHDVEKQIKTKYSEYMKRQTGPEGRRQSFAAKVSLPKFQRQSSQAAVRMEHIWSALHNMGPSLSANDRAKYQAIYERFGSRGEGREERAPEHFSQKITHA
eukprot:m.17300 g.17300  ORF g.17300 m.17300 type:complete len:1388 (+) comp27429_c0_seq1:263-4426(+)